MPPSWTRLVRFRDIQGVIRLGQPVDEALDVGLAVAGGKKPEAFVIQGDVFDGKVTSEKATIAELLSPVTREQANIVRCLGLNYKKHAAEANMALPPAPVLFVKPRTSLTGPGVIPVPKYAQDEQLDYETELAVVIGKDALDVSEADAFDYILGYTASNDVSARKNQLATSQWCFGKGHDNFAPIGPVLVSHKAVGNPDNLDFSGKHNDKVVQQDNTNDMIFSVATTIAHLSKGTTLEKGSVILMGTPSGIGWFEQPKRILRDGDTFSITYGGGIGTLVNTFKYL